MLLPAAENFFPGTGSSDKEPKEFKSFFRDGVGKKTFLAALPRPPQIAKESQKKFAGLMADAAGDVEVFAVGCEDG